MKKNREYLAIPALVAVVVFVIYQVYFAPLSSASFQTLGQALSQIGSINRTLIVTTQLAVPDNTTVPKNVHLDVKNGGTFNRSLGAILTINGPFTAGLYQVFEGPGTTAFGAGTIESFHPEWWGAADGVDSTTAIKATIAAMGPGDTFSMPRSEFWTTEEISLAGKSRLTIAGSNMMYSRISLASGVSSTRSVFSLLGASYITMRDLELYSATNGANSPKAILILGRTSTGSFGGHRFDRISTRGYATQTAIYSIASEENSWENVWAELDGGGGKYVFYTSGADDLGLTGFTSSTNLSMWFNHFRFFNASSVDNAATIYILAAASSGDIVFRDGFLASVKGSHVELSAYTGGGAGNYTFSNIRAENGGVNPTYGIKFTSSGGTTISRIRVEDCNFDSGTYFMYADDSINIVNSTFSNNQHTVTDNSVTSSFYTGSYLTFFENYSHITFRNTINGGHVVMMNPSYTFDGGTNPKYTIQDNFGRYRNIKQNLPTGATPSVQYGNLYHTANGGATTITNLTNGSLSQEVVIVCQDNVTSMTDNTTAGLTLNGNFSCTTIGDTIRLINDGTAWRELSRSVN